MFGCGPVGQFAIASAKLQGAGRVLAVDSKIDRLSMAQVQGAETINFDQEDPVQTIVELTGGIGVDRVIDAVGVDAEHPHSGPGRDKSQEKEFEKEVEQIAPNARPKGDHWHPGDAPSQALQWGVEALAKAGTLGIIGVYPPVARTFPIGMAMNKNLTVKMGNCHHRKYVPHLVGLVRSGVIDPVKILTKVEPVSDAIAAYEAFDQRQPGWLKVKLEPAA